MEKNTRSKYKNKTIINLIQLLKTLKKAKIKSIVIKIEDTIKNWK